MWKIQLATLVLVALVAIVHPERVDYSGHKVLSVVPENEFQLQFLYSLRTDYQVDFWNEPRTVGNPVLFHLRPNTVGPILEKFKRLGMEHNIVFDDLQRTIEDERTELKGVSNMSFDATSFDFGKYNQYDEVIKLLKDLSSQYSSIAQLETIGTTFERRPIYNLKISAGESKPAIMMECGIHAREWSSVAACAYLVNKLITSYGTDQSVTSLLDKYEYNVVVEANPDGYVYTWTQDRLWRKTRSRSSIDVLGICRGADANRNFDIEHCGVGTSRKPCDDIYCGDKPFSEAESRALRDLMVKLGSRTKAYFSIHAYSQLWMTPYGTTKSLPPNYSELSRVGNAGVQALAQKYGTQYRLGSIANIIYEAAGSSVDYAYVKQNIKIAFALELRDTGRHGFFLPRQYILPMCEETFDGLQAAIASLQ